VLGVQDLSISFGGLAALSGLSFEVRDREIFALIGPNGAGKSTVFNLITGLYRPSRGRITLGGDDLLALAPHQIARRGVARTFQNTEVFRRLTALDNVLIGRHVHLRMGVIRGALALPAVGREESRAREAAHALLARFGLDDVAGIEAGSLPLGAQKRLEIARAMASEPRLLLLDEPAGGLNPTETRTLMAVIRGLRDERGLTIVVVEHDMDLVMGISDRVAVLDHGRKIAEGAPREIVSNAAVVEAYLGSEDDP
jgi:branched-chain amino acid transport system ATP-binding protein